ncbi:MAG: hypothetical protein FWB79_03405 [Treponema sp.]|nr:hypothetical protein [Treponema sp.]
MGGLIVRAYINKLGLKNVERCVFIATPHRGSCLAKISRYVSFYNKIFKPLKSLRPSAENKYLLKSSIEIGLIAESGNNTVLGKMFLPAESNGRVELFSALSNDAKDTIILLMGTRKYTTKRKL